MTPLESTEQVVQVLSPTKARQLLTAHVAEASVNLGGQDQEQPPKSSSQLEEPVMVEETDGVRTAVMETCEPTAEQEKELAKIAGKFQALESRALYGEGRRKPGKKWSVDPTGLSSYGGVKNLSGSLEIEFKEVKEVGGRVCGIFTHRFDLTGNSTEEGPMETFKSRMEGTCEVVRSLEDLIDLEAVWDCALTVSGETGEDGSMKVSGRLRLESEAEIGRVLRE